MTAARRNTLWFNLSEVPGVTEDEYIDWVQGLGCVWDELATMDFGFRSKTLVICYHEEADFVRFETSLPDPLVFGKTGLCTMWSSQARDGVQKQLGRKASITGWASMPLRKNLVDMAKFFRRTGSAITRTRS